MLLEYPEHPSVLALYLEEARTSPRRLTWRARLTSRCQVFRGMGDLPSIGKPCIKGISIVKHSCSSTMLDGFFSFHGCGNATKRKCCLSKTDTTSRPLWLTSMYGNMIIMMVHATVCYRDRACSTGPGADKPHCIQAAAVICVYHVMHHDPSKLATWTTEL